MPLPKKSLCARAFFLLTGTACILLLFFVFCTGVFVAAQPATNTRESAAENNAAGYNSDGLPEFHIGVEADLVTI